MKAILARLSRDKTPFVTYGEADALLADAPEFRECATGHWSGFYDWLRDQEQRIIGVRFWPFEDVQFLVENYRNVPGVGIQLDRAVLIFFGPEADYIEESSDDQEFQEARVLVNAAGEHALLLGCTTIRRDDFKHAF